MSYIRSGSSSSGASAGPSSSTSPSRSPSVEPSVSIKKERRLTLQDIHIPAGFEIAKHLGEPAGTAYPSEENIQKAAEVLQSLRGRMPDGSDGQVAACDYCRRRKIRCDRTKPTCGSCVASGRKCTTEDMLRKRGPPSKKERAILEAAGIIFRGTRPHRRRRTATTSLGSGAASKQQEEMLRKVQEAAGTRTRANSTNSGEQAAAVVGELVDGFEASSRSSWMEMLSIATQSANPFADSPASSPSDISAQDTFHIDAGACDYGVPPSMERNGINNGAAAQWESMWATFGADLRNKYSINTEAAGAPFALPNLTAFACNTGDDASKEAMLRGPLASFDAGALDWSATHLSPSPYQMLFPPANAPRAGADAAMSAVHMDPQMMAPHHMHQPAPQQGALQESFIASPSSLAAEAVVFQSAMGHFFPKHNPLSSSLSNASSSSSTAEAGTPTELEQFISLAETTPSLHQHHYHHHQLDQQQQHQLQFSLAF